jgi:putative transposase
MMLRKAYRFRMHPTKTQEVGLYRMAGARRFVYNWALSRRKDHYAEHGKGISARELSSELTALKRQPETLWLKEADSQMLQQALRDVDRAYDAFFKRRSRLPRLRSKKAGHFTFRIPQRVRVEDGRVYVPKVGWIRIRQSRGVEGTTKSATFKRDACGHWYVALTSEFEIPEVEPPAPANPVGVDLGLKDLFVLSDGERVPAPRIARTAERRLGRVQKDLSRKKPGSRRREKAKLCSECGALNPNLKLVDRTWLCSSCGTQHDRDLNAARNILAEGMRVLAAGQTESQNARGEPVSLPRGSTAR